VVTRDRLCEGTGVPPDAWFPDDAEQARIPKDICRACPSQQPCLAGALARGEHHGVWGAELFRGGRPTTWPKPDPAPDERRETSNRYHHGDHQVPSAALSFAVRDSGIGTRELARLAGLSHDTICAVRSGNRTWVQAKTAAQITDALTAYRTEQGTSPEPEEDSESAA
jgi:hypothetical protein